MLTTGLVQTEKRFDLDPACDGSPRCVLSGNELPGAYCLQCIFVEAETQPRPKKGGSRRTLGAVQIQKVALQTRMGFLEQPEGYLNRNLRWYRLAIGSNRRLEFPLSDRFHGLLAETKARILDQLDTRRTAIQIDDHEHDYRSL